MKKQINAKFLIVATAIAVVFMMSSNAKAQQQGCDKLPGLDFSELEKEYELVRCVYTDDGYIRPVVKPKLDPPHIHNFGIKFFDEDGAEAFGLRMFYNGGYMSPVGTVEKWETLGPYESKLKNIKYSIVYRVVDDGTLIGPKPDESKKNSTANNSADAKKPEQTKNDAAVNNKSDAKCDYAALPSTSSFPGFSAALAKSGIYERYSFEKDTGGISSPADVGVTFLDVKLLDSYKNTVRVDPVHGAQRIFDGAPVGVTIYRFSAKYIVCRKYSDSTRRTQFESDNVCFKDKNGGWNCPVDSVPVITELN